jgi:hypothetical protein
MTVHLPVTDPAINGPAAGLQQEGPMGGSRHKRTPKVEILRNKLEAVLFEEIQN